jgi:hypothetical protein
MPTVTANQLYRFICANAEEIDGEIICRASLWAELERRGIPRGPERQQLRVRLVKELEARGLVKRIHPRSRRLLVLDTSRADPTALRPTARFFAHDARGTKSRIKRLERYFAANVLDGKRFVCSSWAGCESSIGPDSTFKEGQLSHVGKHFDLSRDGRDLRVVVVGQEVAGKGKPRTTMAERYANVHDGSGISKRFVSDGGHERRNPHMRGTTLALRTIFELPGINHATEFLYLDEKSVHLFDCFALVNRLLCAAHLAGTSTGKSTKTMLNNCERHFQATLKILEPTIVVIQGIKVWKWSKNVLVPVKKRSENLFECDLAGRRVMVAAFTHPSAWGPDRWDSPQSPYFRDVVRPTLRRADRQSRPPVDQ